jgi:MFS family permease
MFALACAFPTTHQAYYLLKKIGSGEDEVPRQILVGTLVMAAFIVAASLLGGGLSDHTGRRKAFVCSASFVFGLAMFALALAGTLNGFLIGMAFRGLGFGLYVVVDLALVADVGRELLATALEVVAELEAWYAAALGPRRHAQLHHALDALLDVTGRSQSIPTR